MSTTDSPPPTDQGPRVTGPEVRDLRHLRRTTKASPEGRHIAGVAGGVARHFDIDPVLVRVLLVVLVFFGGAGLLLYGAGWLFIPEEGSDQGVVPLDDKNRSLALYVAAGLAALALLGDTVGSFHFPWPLAVIALVVLVVLGNRNRVKTPDWRPFGGQPPAQPPAAYDVDAPIAPIAEDAATSDSSTAAFGMPPTAAPPYAPPYAPAYVPPYVAPPYVAPPNPRRRGPILFWFTLALIALALGTLGIIDGAGASIADSAYPAVAVGITGAMLALGAFWGRAGGLILVGLVSTVALVGAVAADEYDGHEHRVHATPQTAADVKDDYHMDAGELVLDLTEVTDPSALDGRTIDLEGGVGKMTVVIPDEWGVRVNAHVGIGSARVLDTGENGGLGVDYSAGRSGGVEQPDIKVDAHLGVGAIEVLDEGDYQPWRN